MTDSIERRCPKCGQQLRFPRNVGGMVMACPSCGHRFYSDFKLRGTGNQGRQGVLGRLLNLPYRLLRRLFRGTPG